MVKFQDIESVDFVNVAREIRCKWSPENDKKSLVVRASSAFRLRYVKHPLKHTQNCTGMRSCPAKVSSRAEEGGKGG